MKTDDDVDGGGASTADRPGLGERPLLGRIGGISLLVAITPLIFSFVGLILFVRADYSTLTLALGTINLSAVWLAGLFNSLQAVLMVGPALAWRRFVVPRRDLSPRRPRYWSAGRVVLALCTVAVFLFSVFLVCGTRYLGLGITFGTLGLLALAIFTFGPTRWHWNSDQAAEEFASGGAIGILLAVLISMAALPESTLPGVPPEEVRTMDGTVYSGYVVNVDDVSLTAILWESRRAVRIPTGDVADRQICAAVIEPLPGLQTLLGGEPHHEC